MRCSNTEAARLERGLAQGDRRSFKRSGRRSTSFLKRLPPLRLCVNDRGGAVYRAAFSLDWRDAKLWDPDTPFLYAAEVELLDGGQVVDQRVEVFGFREFWCEGPRFMLNGIPIRLRGDSWHFQGGLQQTEAYIRNWYRMCRSIGINSVRLHAEPYPEDYVRIADEEEEMPTGSTKAIYGSAKSMLADHPDYIANCRMHVLRLVRRDKNHPSVIMWSLQNEMRWVDGRDSYSAYALLHPSDPGTGRNATDRRRRKQPAAAQRRIRRWKADITTSTAR